MLPVHRSFSLSLRFQPVLPGDVTYSLHLPSQAHHHANRFLANKHLNIQFPLILFLWQNSDRSNIFLENPKWSKMDQIIALYETWSLQNHAFSKYLKSLRKYWLATTCWILKSVKSVFLNPAYQHAPLNIEKYDLMKIDETFYFLNQSYVS